MKFIILLLVIQFDNGASRMNTAPKMKNDTPKSNIIKYDPRPGISIPIMIHLERALTKNLTKHSLKHKGRATVFFKKILKNVENIFHHPSLNQNIHFILLDVKILRNGTKSFKSDENVSKYLKSYCHWQGEKKIVKKKWYYSVLFTGLDLFHLDRNFIADRASTGRGYLGGICSLRNSCSLLEWHYGNIAYILAHEIAHSLGLSHDGLPSSQCKGKYIMNAKYTPRNPAKTWSPCSKRELKQFLVGKKAWCLRG